MKKIKKIALTKFRLSVVSLASTLAILLSTLAPAFVTPVHAGTLTSTYVRPTSMLATAGTPFRLVFTTVGAVPVSGKIVIVFNSGTVASTQTASVATCPAQTGATALPGAPTYAGAGSTVTITLGATGLAATTAYCVDLTAAGALVNPAAGNYTASVTTQNASSVPIDTTNIGLDSLSSANTIGVTATVPPSFTISIAPSTDPLGNVIFGSVAVSTGVLTTVATNATHGWFGWVADANAGLTSATASHTIPSVATGSTTTLTGSTEQYGLDAIINTTGVGDPGSLTIPAGYNGGATGSHAAGGISSSIYNVFAQNTGTGNNDKINTYEMAGAAATTPAANDYIDTLTILGAGSF